MTRINVVPVWELSDQHLIAEYHELPRVLKQNINITDAPEKYCLGKGHVKWARRHAKFCARRFADLLSEMHSRGFILRYFCAFPNVEKYQDYEPTSDDIETNRQRLREKHRLKPNWYRWTNRTKPNWL